MPFMKMASLLPVPSPGRTSTIVSHCVSQLAPFALAERTTVEWASGLEQRFGMQYVNYTTQERDYKLSFLVYRDFIKNHGCADD